MSQNYKRQKTLVADRPKTINPIRPAEQSSPSDFSETIEGREPDKHP